jgi:hypothetical protein
MTDAWIVGLVVLTVPKMRVNILVGWETLHGVTSGCCTHTLCITYQRVHANAKHAVHL